jgi:predicted phage terminase large subunit-like protein
MIISPVLIDRELVARGGLRAFIECAWPQVDPSQFTPGWHIDEICEHLESVSRGECRKLLINIPPGFSKSLIVSVLWPAWDWIRHPDRKYIAASYEAQLAWRDAKKMRELVDSQWFQERWGALCDPPGVSIPHENDRKVGAFKNSRGGFRYSTGTGAGFTGWHAHIHIVDDPHAQKDARGGATHIQKALGKVASWWRETMPSRAVNRSKLARVIVMQRLHEADLSGVVLEEGGYTHLCLPIRYTETSPHRRISLPCKTRWGGDRRTVEGDLLCAGRIDEDEDTQIKVEMGSYAYNGQYMQAPASADGMIIKRAWLNNFWRALPPGGRFIQSWDMAFKETADSSFVVGQCWYACGGQYYLVDQARARMGFTGACTAVVSFSAKHPRAVGKVVEDKANGPAIIDALKKKISGLILVTPEGGKEARLQAVSPLFEAGSVHLPDPEIAPWVHDYIEEMATFPGSTNDDQVDTTSQALTYLDLRTSRLAEAMAAVAQDAAEAAPAPQEMPPDEWYGVIRTGQPDVL